MPHTTFMFVEIFHCIRLIKRENKACSVAVYRLPLNNFERTGNFVMSSFTGAKYKDVEVKPSFLNEKYHREWQIVNNTPQSMINTLQNKTQVWKPS